MDKRGFRRLCRALYAVAIAFDVIAVLLIIGSTLCICHGNMRAIVTLALGFGLLGLGCALGDSTEERMR